MYSRPYRKEKKTRWEIVVPVVLLVVVAVSVVLILVMVESSKKKGAESSDTSQTAEDNSKNSDNKPVEETHKTPEGSKVEVVDDEDAISSDASGYLKITQWGVAYKMPNGLGYISYYISRDFADGNLKLFLSEDDDCAARGMVIKTKKDSFEMGGVKLKGKKIGDNYYFVSVNEDMCSDKSANIAREKLIIEMLQNPVPIRSGATN
jgi:hypothetical protein